MAISQLRFYSHRRRNLIRQFAENKPLYVRIDLETFYRIGINHTRKSQDLTYRVCDYALGMKRVWEVLIVFRYDLIVSGEYLV